MKVCDVTQFYSPRSGGVKRYLHEKIAYIDKARPGDEHVLIVPGRKTEMISRGRSRVYTIHSPLVSRTLGYRVLLNLSAIEHILARERPDIIESGDPYQVGSKSARIGLAFGIPVVGFYHSHFAEAYLRSAAKYFGQSASEAAINLAARYVRNLYNRFEATLVSAQHLAQLLRDWGVRNVQVVELGVNTEVFKPARREAGGTRVSLGVASDQKLLLYVGRLAKEKNTQTLLQAFELLHQRRPGDFHLLIVGDGPQRHQVLRLKGRTDGAVSWIGYCTDSAELARYYRVADLFVHPGTQETFGLVALESQACGTPVVGIRGSNMDRLILHEQEFWARENNAAALADAIANSGKENLRALGTQAADRVRAKYAWPRVFAQLFCIYSAVCANYRHS